MAKASIRQFYGTGSTYTLNMINIVKGSNYNFDIKTQ